MHKQATTRTLPYWMTEGNMALTSTIESQHKEKTQKLSKSSTHLFSCILYRSQARGELNVG